MSLSVAVAGLAECPPARAGVPLVPLWAQPRARLGRGLDEGVEGLLTVVAAPSGAGKSLGVATWATDPSSPPRLVWLDLAPAAGEADAVWRRLRHRLEESGEVGLPSHRPRSAAARLAALSELGEALRARGPWTLVLDDFPVGAPGRLGEELQLLVDAAGRALRVVLLCRAEPALELHRWAAAGEVTRVSDAELVMDADEVAGVLRSAGVAADRRMVARVVEHARGWACGVRRAAVQLRGTGDLGAALEQSDAATTEFLDREVLAAVPAAVRELLVWTSGVERVPPGLLESVLGADARRTLEATPGVAGLVRVLPDGSVACHPLLRAAARARVPADEPADAGGTRRRVADWFADHGATSAAIEVDAGVEDWPAVATVLVRAHAVPHLVAGTSDAAVDRVVERREVQAAEPLLGAAVALAAHDLPAAEAAYARSGGTAVDDPSAHALADAFVQLGIARLAGRAVPDVGEVAPPVALVAEAGLCGALDALLGAVEVTTGRLERARIALARGADRARARGDGSAADCAGQLALLEAYRGDLEGATRRAGQVLGAATSPDQCGLAHARVAMAWIHAERSELAEATAWLERGERSGSHDAEPWLALAAELVEARTQIASGRPDEALRSLASWTTARGGEGSRWLAEQVTVVAAEALLASGEPQQALARVTAGLGAGSVERAVLTAAARRQIGDLRGAHAAVVSAAGGLALSPRATQVQGWALEARLAHERGQVARSQLLVERTLAAAEAEGLRRPLADDAAWLLWFLDRGGSHLRRHRPFVRSLGVRRVAPQGPGLPEASPAEPLEPLTEREMQVLALLAQMCSTEEIAAELFVSVNTVKTHLKGIFRKYGVNRRVEAVRRGRELGRC